MGLEASSIVGILAIDMVVAGFLLSSTFVSADDSVVDEVNITVPVSCSMSGVGMNTHNAEINNGQYNSSIGETTLKALCNDNEGFAIYAIGYTDDTDGKNVLTNTTLGSTYDIITGTAISGDTSNWAMKLSTITTPTPTYPVAIQNSFDAFHNVPDDYTLVAKRTSATDIGQNAEGSILKTTYQAYISKTQPAGTYAGQVKYVLMHPHNSVAPDEFHGKTMQTVSEWGDRVAMGQTTTVIDSRDGKEYTIARLADGQLWMTKNLRLDIGSADITAENTNNPTQEFLNASSSATPSSEWCTDANSACLDEIKYNTSNINNQTIDSDGHTYDEYGMYYNYYAATAGNGNSGSTDEVVRGDICPAGWHLPSGTSTAYGAPATWTGEFWKMIADAGGGIASDNSNYSDLVGVNGVTRLKVSPYNFLFSGFYSGDSIRELGGGYLWSSLKYGSTKSYIFSINSTSVAAFSDFFNYQGLPIRCVTNLAPYSAELIFQESGKSKYNNYYKIQDMNQSICSRFAIGQRIDLIDERDDEVYMVAKLADDHCWTLDNLRLDPTNPTVAEEMNEGNTNATNEAINNLLHGGSTKTGWSNVAVVDADIGFNTYTEPMINNANKDTLVTGYGPASTGGKSKVGIYYNFCAASVGTFCYEASHGVDTSTGQDLCPSNWHIPTGGPGGQYDDLFSKYESSLSYQTGAFNDALSTNLSGYYFEDEALAVDRYSYAWSLTPLQKTNAHILFSEDGAAYPSTYNRPRAYGIPIRCSLP